MIYKACQNAFLAEQAQQLHAAAELEKIKPTGSNPWPKFYALQVLLSAYSHLGRAKEIPATLDLIEEPDPKSVSRPSSSSFDHLVCTGEERAGR